MYECRYGRRSRHRIRKPGVERDLCRFTHRADEQANGYEIIIEGCKRAVLKLCEDPCLTGVAQGTAFVKDVQHPYQKTEIADTVHHKCFLGGIGIFSVFKPKTNQ